MPAITYKEYGGGLDRRLPLSVQDANRLWTLKNAYITSGKKIKKRPALKVVSTSLAGSVGLESMNGGLVVFTTVGSSFTPPPGVGVFQLNPFSPGGGVTELVGINYAKMVLGFPYVVALHRTAVPFVYPPGQTGIPRTVVKDVPRHHYLDGGGTTLITDSNCSHGPSATFLTSRVFTTGPDIVRYSAAGAPRDWTTASDAGFLSVSLQQDTTADPTGVGSFEDALVVTFPEGVQIWDAAVDPTATQIRRRLYGVGTTHPLGMASFYRDLVFPSPFGVRSISVQENVERVDETDVGVPVDELVVPAQQAHEATSAEPVRGIWLQQLGQYWLIYESAGTSRVFAYSFSRSSKLACWSEYTFPVLIKGITSVAGKVYVRSASTLYELDAATFTDAGVGIDVDVQMAFQDAKLPGVEKMFYGADFVFSGTADVSYLYEPSDPGKETILYTVTGDTRAGTVIPVEVSSAAIAPRFRHSADEAFGLDMATLYFHQLSASV
jgi:hypothetical protein